MTAACAPKYTPYSGEKNFTAPSGRPDYRNLHYWAAHPDKWDPSDSIPKVLKDEKRDEMTDVFFLHPTSYTSGTDTFPDNARIDDPYLNRKTDYSSILYQASVFNQSCRVFAPRYRQAHIRMYYIADTGRSHSAFDTAYADVREAFLYYLTHYNMGRPIIIAAHSQGTTHAKRLLGEFFDSDSGLRRQLVAAYILGIPVEKSYFQVLEPCRDSLSTGCYISWRTYRRGFQSPFVSSSDTSIAVINPYTWDAKPGKVSRREHKGAVLYKFNKVLTHTQSAEIAGNALWISKPKFPGGFLYTSRNYHAGDYNLFYVDIRQDIHRRISRYLLNRPS
jgi:hypothetical protein